MRIITPKTTITFGLVSIMASIMISVMFMGIGPNLRATVMHGRAQLCESIAVDTSINMSRKDISRIRALLTNIVDRNPDIQSAGIRYSNGKLVIDVGDHEAHWQNDDVLSTETHVKVPLRVAGDVWGDVELRFNPVFQTGLAGWLQQPWIRYIGIASAIAFLVFSFYLGFVLRQLDPSQAVPKRVRTALDSLAEGLLVTDEKGRVILANQAFAGWAGRHPNKLIGRVATKFPWVLKSDSENAVFEFPWIAALSQGAAQAGVILKLVDHRNETLTIVANSSPVLGSDGQYRGVLTSFEDITELEQSKTELIHAKTAADEASRSKSEFLAHMSHEIRTPMNAILGYTEVLRSGSHEPEAVRQKHLNTIQASGQHLLLLINDILDLSKIESGRLDMEFKSCSLQEIFAQCISVMKIKSDEKGVRLDFEAQGKLPTTIVTDEVRLRQTLINLVSNAVKFTEVGGVSIIARMVTQGSRSLLQVDVVDSGIGIAAHSIEAIFQPFSQADNTITRRFGGTGLGLAISRQLVERLGGEMTVTSDYGHGSTFSFTIDPGDLSDVPFTEFLMEDDVAPAPTSTAEPLFKFAGAKILVVDDSETNRELVSLFLRRSEAIVEMASNGQIAMEMALAGDFNAILMDMQMPVMDGFTATSELRRLGYQTPIIALTANAMKDDERKCLDAGCTGFLPKPIGKAKLLSMLAEYIPHTCEIESDSVVESSSNVIENGTEPIRKTNSNGQSTECPDSELVNCEEIYSELTDLVNESKDASATKSAVKKLAQNSTVASTNEQLASSLPIDDEDYLMIVEMFITRLHQQIPTFRAALEAGEFGELANLAHWLKGSGGTAGYDAFTKPSKHLQDAAENEHAADCDQHLLVIEHLASIVVSGASTKTTIQA